jgi:hypothetical protein
VVPCFFNCKPSLADLMSSKSPPTSTDAKRRQAVFASPDDTNRRDRRTRIRRLGSSPRDFARYAIGIPLRPYQQEVADAILASILNRLGLSFVVVFPRQSGKNETLAHIQAYLLCLLSGQEIEIVSVSPTLKPQGLNAIRRLQRCLDRNPFTSGRWHSQNGYIVRLDKAFVHFFSGSSVAQTAGATASALLSVDEAQDVRPSVYDRKFAPMAASNKATRVFWGTPWTSSTLLSREQRRALADQDKDGIRRLWTLTADDVTLAHPLYGEFVSDEILHYGRTHPYIRTQYFREEIDSQASMFNPARMALIFPSMQAPSLNAEHMSRAQPRDLGTSRTGVKPVSTASTTRVVEDGVGLVGEGADRAAIAFLLDLAGQDESRMDDLLGESSSDETPLDNPARDSACLSIVSIDLSTLATLQAPTYRILHRLQWVGVNHLTLFGQLKALAESWHPQYIVMDATGVGEGLRAVMEKTFPKRVIPVKFNRAVKSELGWKFLSIIDTGRLRDSSGVEPSWGAGGNSYFSSQTGSMPSPDLVRLQYVSCRSEALPGPSRTLRWGVPDGARGPDGQLIHDDILLADSLVAALDSLEWVVQTQVVVIEGFDPLSSRERFLSHVKIDF